MVQHIVGKTVSGSSKLYLILFFYCSWGDAKLLGTLFLKWCFSCAEFSLICVIYSITNKDCILSRVFVFFYVPPS